MADIDAELLALAGGDESSGEETPPSPNNKSPSASPSPPQPSNQRNSKPPEIGRKGGQGGKKAKMGRRRPKQAESEDGELCVLQPNLLPELTL